jgi:serine/threonine protein kinase/tetratricopeptide (TPR) repeat protein
MVVECLSDIGESMIDRTISHYKILEKIGSGGMGVVYKAEDTRLERTVALKFLPEYLTRDDVAKKRFIKEAKTASSLDHPNVCTIHEIDETDEGQLFIAMACYEGETLRERIERGQLSVDEALSITIQVAQGLTKAHEHRILHRDIKPGNIFITKDGQVKILDFGLAKLAGETRITKEGTTGGTIAYMSPEQAQGKDVDTSTDIWSLGVVLYEMLTGKLPFKGENWKVTLYSIIHTKPESIRRLRSDVPIALEQILDLMMQKDTSTRYKDTTKLITKLFDLVSDSGFAIQRSIMQQDTRQSTFGKLLIPSLVVVTLIIAFLLLKDNILPGTSVDDRETIAVMTFKNLTGEKDLDYLTEAIPNLLITSLEQSEHLNVMTHERMHDLLKAMGKDDVQTIEQDMGFELCRRDGVETVILGSYTKADTIYATDVKVLDVRTKNLLVSVSAQGYGLTSIIREQIDKLSFDITRNLEIPSSTLAGTSAQTMEITTTSMKAYTFFLRGQMDYEKHYDNDAKKYLEKALEIDSTFASAYLYLARTYDRLRDITARNDAYIKANHYANQTTKKEQLYIQAAHASIIEDDPEKAINLLKEIAHRYPKEKNAHNQVGDHFYERQDYSNAIKEYTLALKLDPVYGDALCGLAYTYAAMGNYTAAINKLKTYATVSPGDANPFDSMGDIYFMMGSVDSALINYTEAIEIKPDFNTEWKIAYTYALKEDYTETFRWLNQYIEMAPTAGIKALGYLWQSFYALWIGNADDCLKHLDTAMHAWRTVGHTWGAENLDVLRGIAYYELHKVEASREHFDKWHEFIVAFQPNSASWRTSYYNYCLGLLDLKEGKIENARSRLPMITENLPGIRPDNLDWFNYRYTILYGEILIAADSLDKAIAHCNELPASEPFEWIHANLLLHNLYLPRDVLARALLHKGNVDEAIAEYEKLVSLDPKDPYHRLINPQYHYDLARLYDDNSQYSLAIDEYRTYIEIVKNTDIYRDNLTTAEERLERLVKNHE